VPPSPRSSAFVCYRVATISKSAAEADYRFLGMKKFSEISSRNSKIDNILPAFWKKFSKNYKPGRPILISGRLLVALHPWCRHDSFFHDMCFHQNYSCITFCHGFHFFCVPLPSSQQCSGCSRDVLWGAGMIHFFFSHVFFIKTKHIITLGKVSFFCFVCFFPPFAYLYLFLFNNHAIIAIITKELLFLLITRPPPTP